MNSNVEVAVEKIVLAHGERGMDILREYLPKHYFYNAAKRLFGLERGNIFLTTGFYVEGHPETDGPPGTYGLAAALREMGFNPIIVTDKLLEGLMDDLGFTIEYCAFDAGQWIYEVLMEEYKPVAVISIERCGINIDGDYANMRGISIAHSTAKVDYLFEIANNKQIPTFGIGDGGNEIGMGNLKDQIGQYLGLVPCATKVDYLMVATVSNWGAYALAIELSKLEGKNLLMPYSDIRGYLKKIVTLGAIDGVHKLPQATEDAFDKETSKSVVDNLHKVLEI
ncbi:MAG: DUF4392 domain-containing protein [Lachnospiraceae bacterium]|jgi:hypothetical protein|nr:DUF4392 domain-containing protein [Lachnospiraceae bacterium]